MDDNIFFKRKDLGYVGENVIIGKTVRIRHPELVHIGDNCIIDDFTLISGRVTLGCYVHIASSCSLQAGAAHIEIGNFSGVSAGCRIYGSSSDFLRCSFDSACYPAEATYGTLSADVCIAEHVFIGSNTVVLPGTNVPIGLACAALCKISSNMALRPWTLMSQNPESVVRRIHKSRLIKSAAALLKEAKKI